MRENLLTENVISLGTAARMFPGSRGAEQTSPSTVYRWAVKGTRTSDGRTIRLEHFRAGCRVMTTRQAVERYVQALTSTGNSDTTPIRTPAARTRASEDAVRALEKLGA